MKHPHSPTTYITAIIAIVGIAVLVSFFMAKTEERTAAGAPPVPVEEDAATGEASSMPPVPAKAIRSSTRPMRYQQQERREEPMPATMETRQNITVRSTTTLNATYRQEARIQPMT